MSTNIQSTNAQQGKRDMPRVKVRQAADITLPEEARAKLGVSEGDELDVEVVEGGVLLRPVAEIDRRAAWERVLRAPEAVRYIGPEPRPSPEEEEEQIFAIVREFRERHG